MFLINHWFLLTDIWKQLCFIHKLIYNTVAFVFFQFQATKELQAVSQARTLYLSATINVSLEDLPSAAKPWWRVSQTPQLPHHETSLPTGPWCSATIPIILIAGYLPWMARWYWFYHWPMCHCHLLESQWKEFWKLEMSVTGITLVEHETHPGVKLKSQKPRMQM